MAIFKLMRPLRKIFNNMNSNLATSNITNVRQLKTRENPLIMKLDTIEFQNIISTQEVSYLKEIFDKYHYEIRIIGGGVRDLLLGQSAKDLDFATTATPSQMEKMFTNEKIKKIYMFAAKHGTVRAKISENMTFEITTLRLDKATDGRHADVEFIKDWKLDAQRRDFTFNSMSLGFDGSVHDYFFGYDDLQKRKIVFIGNPDMRIKEDYLRIMRYFRFYAKVAENADNHDKKILKIIKNNSEGLLQITGQKIWIELYKILTGRFSGNLLKTMINLDIGKYIGIQNQNTEELCKLIERSGHLNLHPMTYLAALMRHVGDVAILHERLNLSSYEKDMLVSIIKNRDFNIELPLTKPLDSLYRKIVYEGSKKIEAKYVVDYLCEILKYRGDTSILDSFNKWRIPKFHINNKILLENGVPAGTIGSVKYKLRKEWIQNNFTTSAEDLIKLIPHILKQQKN